MTKEKSESGNSPSNSEEHGTLGPDVYENARKLNIQLATRGPAILYALGKASEQVTNGNVVTAVGGMVVGAIGFFGNRFYRTRVMIPRILIWDKLLVRCNLLPDSHCWHYRHLRRLQILERQVPYSMLLN